MTGDYNPWSGDDQEANQDTPPLDEILRAAIEGIVMDVHTWLPAQVVKVHSSGAVDLKLLLQAKYRDGTLVTLPILQSVPVEHPRGADWWIRLPIAVGDYGRASFSERSLDAWLVKGGVVDPADVRHHDLSDGIFIPGLYPKSEVIAGDLTEMVIHNKDAEIILQKAGKFKMKNEANELLATLSATLQTLIDALVVTDMGPQPFMPATIDALAALKAKIDDLKGT